MIKRKFTILTTLIIISMISFAQNINHNLNVNLNIKDKTINVVDIITLDKGSYDYSELPYFYLNKNLQIESLNKDIVITKAPKQNKDANYYMYLIKMNYASNDKFTFTLKYSGIISEEILGSDADYARGFNETNGIICDKGVYLASSSYWYQTFDNSMVEYSLTVTLPSKWHVVSQGSLSTPNEISDSFNTETYTCDKPQQEIYLIAAPFTIYEKTTGKVKVQAYLRTADEELANKYIDKTADYLKMYEDLLGQYPYTKFTLTENFWETGYGMPSFTLLGEQVIRLPFILYTSYPHELLHNWWGNSVYVDYEKGNWCEGITAYMADHMLKEQKGKGADYRRATLQKFTDYVNDSNDFPIVEFRQRSNAAEEAIGYGKTLMFNHMLRKKVGDKNYIAAYRKFYIDYKFKIASFDDIRKSFQPFTDEDLKPFFDQWLLRKGAPLIELTNVDFSNNKLEIILSQIQSEDVFVMDIPVAIYFNDKVEMKTIKMTSKTEKAIFNFDKQPIKIEVDPQFDVFRTLYKSEVPTALSQLYGSTDGLIILPKDSKYIAEYVKMAEAWKKSQEAQGNIISIGFDAGYSTLPKDKAVWIFGYENKFANIFEINDNHLGVLSKEEIQQIDGLKETGCLVFAITNPTNSTKSIGFVGSNNADAIPGLTRLLPHYGKYSYLGFEGNRPNNVIKGLFPAMSSPLHYLFKENGKIQVVSVKLKENKPLTY